MKILFLNKNQPCYVSEPLFHGLRTVLGKDCVDVPRYDSLYKNVSSDFQSALRGKGFTIYGELEDIPELDKDRYFWLGKLNEYDYIVIASIWDMGETYIKLKSMVSENKIILLDGYDQPALFPYALRFLKRIWPLFAIKRNSIYFKREHTSKITAFGLGGVVPKSFQSFLEKRLPSPKNLENISFSILESKISKVEWSEKTKDFPIHIVDKEVASNHKDAFHSGIASDRYCFDTEKAYYEDLKKSRWGITTKRAGWDCLRHYELAANGCILCFKNLDKKPESCSPYGLNEKNSISYNNYTDLMNKISAISDNEAQEMQINSYEWIHEQTTRYRATQFINTINEFSEK